MHEKVAEYLARQRQKETAFREKKLVEMGLCQREYLPEGTKQTQDVVLEYPYTEGERRYKVVAIPVTDEEWEEICAHTDRGPVRRRNRVSQPCGFSGSWPVSWALGRESGSSGT